MKVGAVAVSLNALLKDGGDRLRRAAAGRAVGDDVRMRIDAAYGVLGELGGVADVEEGDGEVWIRGFSCPLAALVPEHPQVCVLAEALLSRRGCPLRRLNALSDSSAPGTHPAPPGAARPSASQLWR